MEEKALEGRTPTRVRFGSLCPWPIRLRGWRHESLSRPLRRIALGKLQTCRSPSRKQLAPVRLGGRGRALRIRKNL